MMRPQLKMTWLQKEIIHINYILHDYVGKLHSFAVDEKTCRSPQTYTGQWLMTSVIRNKNNTFYSDAARRLNPIAIFFFFLSLWYSLEILGSLIFLVLCGSLPFLLSVSSPLFFLVLVRKRISIVERRSFCWYMNCFGQWEMLDSRQIIFYPSVLFVTV